MEGKWTQQVRPLRETYQISPTFEIKCAFQLQKKKVNYHKLKYTRITKILKTDILLFEMMLHLFFQNFIN